MSDEFAESMEQAAEYAAAWRFQQDGALIVGHVVGFGEFDGGWGAYPILTLRLEDGAERAVHAQQEVLVHELAKARPRIGERIGIKWLGQPEGKSYHRYRVRVDRPEGETVDWDRYADGSAAEPASPAPARSPAPGPQAPPTATPAHDDDIPF